MNGREAEQMAATAASESGRPLIERDGLLATIELNRIDGLGPRRYARLAQRFGRTSAALGAPVAELLEAGLPEDVARRVASRAERHAAEEELLRAERAGVTILAREDPRYPAALAEIADPPPVLYVRGELRAGDAVGVAIVGARKATGYGRRHAERLGEELAGAGVTVVSGLARGIDGCAHRGALAAEGGRTIAVLGSGLERVYPPEHADLASRIAERGAVVSELPLDAHPSRETFPRRNRVIAGLSLGVIVVEAEERSGALITVDHALELGRHVFALPGPVGVPQSVGPHKLIRQGATLCEGVVHVALELPDVAALVRDRLKDALPLGWDGEPSAEAPPELDGTARAVLACLTGDPLHTEEVIRDSGLPAGDVAAAFATLLSLGRARELPGGYFVRR